MNTDIIQQDAVLTIAQFIELISRDDWKHSPETEIFTSEIISGSDEEELTQVSGSVATASTIPRSTITIRYTEGFSYIVGKPETLESDCEGLDEFLAIEGFTVIDEDGETLDQYDLIAIMHGKSKYHQVCDFTRVSTSAINCMATGLHVTPIF